MSKNDQPFHHTSVTCTYWFHEVCIISMVICWLCLSQPMALVSLWLSSKLQLLKSDPLCPRKRVCNQTDQVPGPPPSRMSYTLALAEKDMAERGGLCRVGFCHSLREELQHKLGPPKMCRGCPAAVPSAWSPGARKAPWTSRVQELLWGQHPKTFL